MLFNRICKECLGVLSRPNASYCSKCRAPVPDKVEIFLSYAHHDEAFRDQLAYQLSVFEREKVAAIWHDRLIVPGTNWQDAINAHLNTAEIILPLVSPNYIASDSCYGEMECAMDRHSRNEAYTIPIIMRPVDWSRTPLRDLQARPKDGKPVNTWVNQDEALLDVIKGIRLAIEQIFA